MQATYSNYRDVIRVEYSRRRQRNPSYSLRAFARDLKFTYSRLNEVLNAKRGISSEAAERLAKGLGLSPIETRTFVRQVEASHARSATARKSARLELEKDSMTAPDKFIQLDVFEVICNWYHYAILELTQVRGFKSDITWISKRLGISRIEASDAIERLLRIGLLVQDRQGRWSPSQNFTFSTEGVPSQGIKRHHEQILEKAKDAIHLQDLETRDLSSVTFAIRSDLVPLAKQKIQTFRRELMRELETESQKEGPDAVYCLATHFFRLDQTSLKENEKQ